MTLLDTLNQQHCSSIEEMLQCHYQTHRHCERMVPPADAFAEACDLHGQARDILLYSTLFHDIGVNWRSCGTSNNGYLSGT